MTELGVHAVLFPFVRHELAKSVVCSLVLKCLEPVLVIAAWITVDRDICKYLCNETSREHASL